MADDCGIGSLMHVHLICKYAAGDLHDNMKAAIFYNGSPWCANMEDVFHCWAVLLQVCVGE